MKYRGLPILAAGFAILIVLTAVAGVMSTRRSAAVAREIAGLQQDETDFDVRIEALRSDVYLEAVLVRDILLDPSSAETASLREQIEDLRRDIDLRLRQLPVAGAEGGERLDALRGVLKTYHEAISEILSAGPDRTRQLLRDAAATRQSVIEIADSIRSLSKADAVATRTKILEGAAGTESALRQLWSLAVVLSITVAGAALLWIGNLEKGAESSRREIEINRESLRSLSNAIVRVQEEERKRLSLELHDQVGQLLTALRIEIRAVAGSSESSEVASHAEEALKLSDDTLQILRDIALGLRPSMLDDLGLGSALEWLARDFSRRSGVSAIAKVDDRVNDLPESHRTCMFRIAQESLTNVLRHAQARNVELTIGERDRRLFLTVQDDGRGIAPGARRTGMGILGMQERAREFGGTVSIDSPASGGTCVRAELPLS